MTNAHITAAVLIIGNEILSGQTQDTNLNYLAKVLAEKGIDLIESRTLRDDETAIIHTLRDLQNKYDHIFTTGGIGPTHDDITTASIAKALNLELETNPLAKKMLMDFYGEAQLSKARLKMALIPRGAQLITNAISGAPGYSITNTDLATIHVLAGIPEIMQDMFNNLAPKLKTGIRTRHKSLIALTGESKIARQLTALQNHFPGVEIGSYPKKDQQHGYYSKLVLRSKNEQALDQAYQALTKILEDSDIKFI